MRSSTHSPIATAMLMIPILTIPLLAIFGVPQLTPIVSTGFEQRDGADRRREADAPEFTPGPAKSWEEIGHVKTAGNAVMEHAWPEVPPDATTRTLADRRALAQIRTVAATQDDLGPPTRPNQRSEPAGIGRPPAATSLNLGDGQAFTVENRPPASPNAQPDNLGYYRDSPKPARPLAAPPGVASTSAAPLTWKAAVRRLDELEIRNFRLERGQQAEQFIFICSYTPPDNPRISYRFEAESDDPLMAVEKVFSQIDAWLAGRNR